ncbi:methyltransferase [Thermoleophilia bacterium SCSIO 60948]|nr:methyltransferase [Thermoleophilia bacterium SCSIO 60948]
MSTSADHFDRLYAADPDPWRYASSEYERAKYARTLEAIGPHPGLALEVGCSIGVFTSMLAPRCDHLDAIDLSSAAVDHARRRNRGVSWVRIERMDITSSLPPGPFDLIVCSEVLYYLGGEVLDRTIARLTAVLAPGGRLISVNWRGSSADMLSDALSVDAAITRADRLRRVEAATERDYLLGVWERD